MTFQGMLVVPGGLLVWARRLVGLGAEAFQEPAPEACG